MPDPKLMIVGEAWGEKEAELGAPFVGYSGQLLDSMLRAANIKRDDCFLTNVFNFQPTNNKLESLAGPKSEAIEGLPQLGQKLWIRKTFQPELDRLWRQVKVINPNVIVALGATPLWALCGLKGIKKYRGTPVYALRDNRKVLPTYHPAAVGRSWKLRPIVIADLYKASEQALFPELVRPKREIWVEPTLSDLDLFYKNFIAAAPNISADIETKQGTITEIGFAPSPTHAIVVPFYLRATNGNYWPTAMDELRAWRWCEKVFANHGVIGQNFSYDLQYLWGKNHIRVPHVEDDTMILHHTLYPEMEKSLGFLGSIYTDEPSWKFMRTDHDNFKRED